MTRKKRVVKILLLVGLLSTTMIGQARLVSTPEAGARLANRPRGIALQVDVSDDDGPPPCTVASPCESWF